MKLAPHSKLSSLWIIDLKVRGKTIKPLEDNEEKYVHKFV